jgi:hypothetical protein
VLNTSLSLTAGSNSIAADEVGLLEVLVSPPSQQLAHPKDWILPVFEFQPTEMQKEDPLATEISGLYSRIKEQLPNEERMENLTWRMMATSLRKRSQEEGISLRSSIPDPYREIRIDPIEPETLMIRLLEQACSILSIGEVLEENPWRENPWRLLLFPLACTCDSSALYYAIAATAAFHISKGRFTLPVGVEHQMISIKALGAEVSH